MGVNTSPLAFDDTIKLMDRALASEKGIRVNLDKRSAAVTLRMRCNTRRAQDRRESRNVYPPDHPKFGHSEYDRLIFVIGPKGSSTESTLEIKIIGATEFNVEELE